MPKAVLIVTSAPVSAEREDEYNDWYDNIHLADICALPGFVGAKRYKLAGDADQPYLAVYDIDHDDPEAAMGGIMAGVQDGSVRMSDVLAMDPAPGMNLYVER